MSAEARGGDGGTSGRVAGMSRTSAMLTMDLARKGATGIS